ncbi:MAG: hypothetical protein JO257_17520 [Deltaproteobacteria bacterium]|nr:hypothetical protein [Deltaproteobacteria bacterium]
MDLRETDAVSRHQDDPDLTFPYGCTAYIPECSCCFRGQTRQFVCTSDNRGGGGWGEPL